MDDIIDPYDGNVEYVGVEEVEPYYDLPPSGVADEEDEVEPTIEQVEPYDVPPSAVTDFEVEPEVADDEDEEVEPTIGQVEPYYDLHPSEVTDFEVDVIEQSEDGGRVDLDTFEGDPYDIRTMDDLIEWLEKFGYDDGRQVADDEDEVEPIIEQFEPFHLPPSEVADNEVDVIEQSEEGGRVDLDTFEGDPSDIGTMDALIEWLEKFDYDDGRVEKVEQSSGQYQPCDLEDTSKALAKFEVEQDSQKPSEFERVEHEGRVENVEQGTGKSIPSSWVSGKKSLKTSEGLIDGRSDKSPGKSIPSSWVSGKKGNIGVRVGRSQGQSIPSKWVSAKKPPKFEVEKDSLVDRDKALLYDFQGKIRALWLDCNCTIENFIENFALSEISRDTFDGDDPHKGGLIRVTNASLDDPSDDPLYNDRSHHQESFRSFQEFHDTIQKLKRLVHIYTTWDNAGVRYPDFEIGDNIMLSELWKEIDKFVDCGYWIDVWMHYGLIYWTVNQKPVLHYIVSASERVRITDRVEHGFKTLKHPLDLKKLLGQLEYHLQHLDERSSTYRLPSSASNNVELARTVQSQLNSLFRKPGFKSLLKTTKLDKRYGSLDEKVSGKYKTTKTKRKV